MAVIGNIRKHSTFLVIIIGVALAAFVLGDFAKGNRGSRDINVGEVEGEEITIMDFNSEAEKNIDDQMRQKKTDRLTYQEIFTTKEQTWNDMVKKIIMQNEYDELGLAVSSNELLEIIQGSHPHPLIVQYFSDPNTKKFDRNLVINYLSQMESMDDNAKQQWIRFEKYLKEDHLNSKFNTLISKGFYLPNDLAAVYYNEKSDKADIEYLAAKYVDIKDSVFNPTEKDYENYYKEHKELYKEKASRGIEYVVFPINPSKKDLDAAKKEIDQIAKEFATTVDVPRFVKVNSDNPYDSSWFAQGKLPIQIDSTMFNSPVGTVTNPYFLNDAFHVARLMDVAYRPDSLKASHILIAYKGAFNANPEITRTKEQAKSLCDSILNVLKRSPNKLDALTKEFTNDPSAETNNGDLGWFADGQMVPQFNQAIIDNKIGKFTSVSTAFGYHIIKVTGKTEPVKKVKVAQIDQEVYASDETYQVTFTQASKIATECKTQEEFNNYVSENKLNKRTMPSMREMSNYIPGLTNPRTIIRWAFNENTSVGDVSTVFDLDDAFVVAVLNSKIEEGYAPMESVKDRIEHNVYNQLKGKYFVEQMGKYNNDMNSIKENMDVVEKQVNPLYFSSRNLQGFTIENDVIGTVFGTEPGTVTDPIIGNAAVFIVKVNSIAKADKNADYNLVKNEVITDFVKSVDQNKPYLAVKDAVEIVDNRIDFY